MMSNYKYQFVKLVSFRDLVLWDVKRINRLTILSDFPIVKLGDVIIEQNKREKIFQKPNHEFKILGVNNKVGIFDAYVEKGSYFNQSYKKVETNWLAYNPYRINVGSVGLKLPHHGHEYISPAYVVFSCKKELLPEYLFLLFKTESFIRIIKENTTGSVRQNLSFNTLKTLPIPLPTINIQKEIVSKFQEQNKISICLEREANSLEQEIEYAICNTLGVKVEETPILKGISVHRFKNITKWSVNYILKQGGLSSLNNATYPVKSLGSITESLQYGISEKSNSDAEGTTVLRMNNIQNRQIHLHELKYYNFEKSSIKKENVLLQKGDMLFNRTNSKELVGKSAIFNLDGEYTFASYLIRIKFNKEINPYYINYVLNSQIGRKQIDLMSRQILGQANINSKELKDILVPVPPIIKQNEIVLELDNIVKKQNELNEKASVIRTTHIDELEKSIFKRN